MTKAQKKFMTGKLSRFILREQGRGFAMEDWRPVYKPGGEVLMDDICREVPKCGTVCCIGGSAEVLLRLPLSSGYRVVAAALGLSVEQGNGLFFGWTGHTTYGWPEKFKVRYEKSTTTLAKAKVAISLLKEVARTNGACLEPHE